jgi:hypothetical protein
MEANGVALHEVESDGIHYHLLEASTPDDVAETETLRIATPRIAPETERPPAPATSPYEAGYTELIEALQALEAHAWDVKKRGEVFQVTQKACTTFRFFRLRDPTHR